MVKVEHATKQLAATDVSVIGSISQARPDQPVFEALMIPFLMVVHHVFNDRPTQRCMPNKDHSIQALLLDRARIEVDQDVFLQ